MCVCVTIFIVTLTSKFLLFCTTSTATVVAIMFGIHLLEKKSMLKNEAYG